MDAYTSLSPQIQNISDYYDHFNSSIVNNINPMLVVSVVSLLLLFFIFFGTLGGGNGQEMGSSNTISFIEIIMWALLVFLVLINGLQYFFNINITTSIKNLFGPVPEVDIKIEGDDLIDDVPQRKEEVYNIPDNEYTYEDAKAVCKALGSRLATYNEVENAYNNGAQWCSYGWSDGQMALFPTQKETYDNLQKIEDHQNDCGRPGVNGGYIKNEHIKFGVNCYGVKPKINEKEMRLMENTQPYPLTPKEKRMNKKIEDYKKKLSSLIISPFNPKHWSAI